LERLDRLERTSNRFLVPCQCVSIGFQSSCAQLYTHSTACHADYKPAADDTGAAAEPRRWRSALPAPLPLHVTRALRRETATLENHARCESGRGNRVHQSQRKNRAAAPPPDQGVLHAAVGRHRTHPSVRADSILKSPDAVRRRVFRNAPHPSAWPASCAMLRK